MLNWPFECETPDGRKHFNFEHWDTFYKQKNREYSCPEGHSRYCCDLIFPAERLEDVYVHWSPFGTEDDPMKGCHDINFKEESWSTIWDVYPNHLRHGRPGLPGSPGSHDFMEDSNCEHSCRVIIENDHDNPFGEKVTLLSTALTWENNHANQFAFFRGKYWKTHTPLCYSRTPGIRPKSMFCHSRHPKDWFTIGKMFLAAQRQPKHKSIELNFIDTINRNDPQNN